MSTAVEIMEYLDSQSDLDLEKGVNLFVSKEPANPDECVTIYDIPGSSPDLFLTAPETISYNDSIQVRVRGIDYTEVMNLCISILQFLHNTGNFEIDGTFYKVIEAIGSPHFLYRDDNNRAISVCNFNVKKYKLN